MVKPIRRTSYFHYLPKLYFITMDVRYSSAINKQTEYTDHSCGKSINIKPKPLQSGEKAFHLAGGFVKGLMIYYIGGTT